MNKEQATVIRNAAAKWRLKAAQLSDGNLRIVINTMIAEAEQDAIEDMRLKGTREDFIGLLRMYLSDFDPIEWLGIDEALFLRAQVWFKAQGL